MIKFDNLVEAMACADRLENVTGERPKITAKIVKKQMIVTVIY